MQKISLYTFEVALAFPMFNFATPMLILQPQYLSTWWLFRLSWEKLKLCWEILVPGEIKWLGPRSADSTPTTAKLRMDYRILPNSDLHPQCHFRKFRPWVQLRKNTWGAPPPHRSPRCGRGLTHEPMHRGRFDRASLLELQKNNFSLC